jgi:hypothetical protein
LSISSVQAERPIRRQPKPDVATSACFIDTMRPITEAEHLAWRAYLALPQPHWRAARELFRRAYNGDHPKENLLQFLAEVHVDDPAVVSRFEVALVALAREMLGVKRINLGVVSHQKVHQALV